MKIIWVFGGTGMGKRTWIQQHAQPGDTCLGMEPGHELIKREDLKGETVYIRWQWGREVLLYDLADSPDMEQSIAFIETDRDTQMAQIRSREGYDKYSRDDLGVEAYRVKQLVDQISNRGIPVVTITHHDGLVSTSYGDCLPREVRC